MEVIFNNLGELSNELGSSLENREFKCSTNISVIPGILETELSRVYAIDGYIPKKLTIDNIGVISGVLGLLDDQDTELPRNLLKPIGVDGTNWQDDGSVSVSSYVFNFKIKVTITYRDDNIILDDIILDNTITKDFISEDVGVMIIKNNNIANTKFAIRYMRAGHKMNVGNDSYGLNNINNFLLRNPNSFEVIK